MGCCADSGEYIQPLKNKDEGPAIEKKADTTQMGIKRSEDVATPAKKEEVTAAPKIAMSGLMGQKLASKVNDELAKTEEPEAAPKVGMAGLMGTKLASKVHVQMAKLDNKFHEDLKKNEHAGESVP